MRVHWLWREARFKLLETGSPIDCRRLHRHLNSCAGSVGGSGHSRVARGCSMTRQPSTDSITYTKRRRLTPPIGRPPTEGPSPPLGRCVHRESSPAAGRRLRAVLIRLRGDGENVGPSNARDGDDPHATVKVGDDHIFVIRVDGLEHTADLDAAKRHGTDGRGDRRSAGCPNSRRKKKRVDGGKRGRGEGASGAFRGGSRRDEPAEEVKFYALIPKCEPHLERSRPASVGEVGVRRREKRSGGVTNDAFSESRR